MSSETAQSVTEFFESYRAAFERSDSAAIADLFAYPCHIASDQGEIDLISVATRQEWIGQIERLLGGYRTIGVASARILELTTSELSPRLVQAILHWGLHDKAGGILYDFRAIYTLAAIDGALRITAIAHNEIPQLRAYLAKVQSQRRLDG